MKYMKRKTKYCDSVNLQKLTSLRERKSRSGIVWIPEFDVGIIS